MKPLDLSKEAKRELLERILGAPEFASAERMRHLLRYLWEQEEAPKETVIGVAVFGRDAGYDPKVDGVVRSEVRRLRGKLQEYYAGSGSGERVQLEIPKGTYVVVALEKGKTVEREWPVARWKIALGVVAVMLILGAAAAWTWKGEEREVAESYLVTDSVGQAVEPSLSPDGNLLAYTYRGAAPGIYVRQMDRDEVRRLEGTGASDSWPVMSWDGKRVAYLREEGTNRFAVLVQELSGGEAARWSTLPRRDRMAWLPGDQALVVRDTVEGTPALGLVKLDRQGNRKTLTRPGEGFQFDGMPAVSRDGRRLWFVRAREAGVEELYAQELGEGFAAVGVAKQVTNENRHISRFAVLPDGRSVVAALPRGKTIRALWKIDLDEPAKMTRLSGAQLLAADPTVAANTGRLIYAVAVDDLNVYRVGSGGTAVAVSPSATLESSPDLSPDGKRLAMRSARSGTSEVWVMGDDGSGPKKLTNAQGPVTGSPKWAPGGEWLAFDSRMRGNADVYLVSASGGEPKLMAGSEWNEAVPNWSRDGKWLYYASEQTGKWQLWKMPVDQKGPPVQVTQNGGFLAVESLDGKWIYYSKREPWRGLWRCSKEGGKEELVVDLPESLWGGWALSRDGVYWVEIPPKEKARIVYRAFVGGKERVVHTFEKQAVLWDGQLTVRPDGGEIYFTQLDRSVSDLYRVELKLRE
jgi:Tol biopolymer transport system component